MAGMNARTNKKRETWQYIVLLVIFLAVWFLPQAYVLRENLSTVRVAVLPIYVWQHMIPEPSCTIYPLQLYTIGVPMVDMEEHPENLSWSVKAVGCHGVAVVGPVR